MSKMPTLAPSLVSFCTSSAPSLLEPPVTKTVSLGQFINIRAEELRADLLRMRFPYKAQEIRRQVKEALKACFSKKEDKYISFDDKMLSLE